MNVSTIAGQTPGMLSEPQTQSVPPPFETFACGVEFTHDTLDRRPPDHISCLTATCHAQNTLGYATICQLQYHMRLTPVSTCTPWVFFCDTSNVSMHERVVPIMELSFLVVEHLHHCNNCDMSPMTSLQAPVSIGTAFLRRRGTSSVLLLQLRNMGVLFRPK